MWTATGDVRWRQRYIDHVVTHMEQPALWRDDYARHSHWVPQFGVFAIALSFEEPAVNT